MVKQHNIRYMNVDEICAVIRSAQSDGLLCLYVTDRHNRVHIRRLRDTLGRFVAMDSKAPGRASVGSARELAARVLHWRDTSVLPDEDRRAAV